MDDTTDHDDGGAGDWLDSLPPEQLAALNEMLAISVKDLDDGLGVELDIDNIIARGRARRAAEARAAAE